MWRITLRDLQWRRRRFLLAVLGAALVFAVTLLMSGLAAEFDDEAHRTVAAAGADGWAVRPGVDGPFSTVAALPGDRLAVARATRGVHAADPAIVLHTSARTDTTLDVVLFGFRSGGLGAPPVAEGRSVATRGEAVADAGLHAALGSHIVIGGTGLTVVGLTRGRTVTGGLPLVYADIEDVRAVGFGGQPVTTAILVRGDAATIPGLDLRSNAQVEADIVRPLGRARDAIAIVEGLLWGVAAAIIASAVYLSANERTRDFAVLKATGAGRRPLLIGVASQSVLVALLAAAVSVGLAAVLAPAFPLQLAIPRTALVALGPVALAVGILASVTGVRRALGVDPALAFAGR